MAQTYDIHQSYKFNYDRGPLIDFPQPELPESASKEFLGLKVRSRIGIAAGLLLNSKWIEAYARLGFDILTYKTVRSAKRECHPLPNWVFVDDRGISDGPVYETPFNELEAEKAASAVCFGMPSMAPEVWRADIRRARESLNAGQILVVSVVATPEEPATPQQVASDFCLCAEWAVEAGADVVEANFSCPNVCSEEGTIFLDADLSGDIAAKIRACIGRCPLIIKTGHFTDEEKQQRFLRAIAGVANGVALVNCIVRSVLRPDGLPVFGSQFCNAGVAGRAIHEPAVAAVRNAVDICKKERLDLSVVGVGGVSRVADFSDFFFAGASAVLAGSSPMYRPQLAAEAKRQHPEW